MYRDSITTQVEMLIFKLLFSELLSQQIVFYCNCHSYKGLVKQKHLLKVMLRNECLNVLPFIPALTMIHMHEVTVYTTNAHYICILSVDLTGLLDSRNICTLYRVEMQQDTH